MHTLANGLTSIAIPNSVTRLQSTFADCIGLKNVKIEDGVNELEVSCVPDGIDSKNVFYNCPLETVYLGRDIEYYRDNNSKSTRPFENCTTLETLVVGDSVTEINKELFAGCVKLQSVDIGNGVEKIMAHAFKDCSALETVNIGSSVNSIGDKAFNGCTSLITINSLNSTPPVIQETTFSEETYDIATLNVPIGCKTIYWLHPYWENFYNIVEKDFPSTGISETISENVDCGYRIGNYGLTFTKDGEYMRIYTIQGVLLYSGKSSIGKTIYLPSNTVYIIKTSKQTTKIIL